MNVAIKKIIEKGEHKVIYDHVKLQRVRILNYFLNSYVQNAIFQCVNSLAQIIGFE
jgi:hypothetical protein